MHTWHEIRREEILCALREWNGPTVAAATDLRMSVEELLVRIETLRIAPSEWKNEERSSQERR